MSTILLLLLNGALTLAWMDVFHLGYYLKLWLGYKPEEHIKPFDCYFCTCMWLGIIISSILFVFTGDLIQSLTIITLNFYQSKLIDKLWN